MDKLKLVFKSNCHSKVFVSEPILIDDLLNAKYENAIEDIKAETVLITDSLAKDSLEEIYNSYFLEAKLFFSGQLDKDEKEIYQGAVIKVPDDYDTYGMNAGEEYLVYFGHGGFRCKPKYRKDAKGFYLEDNREMILLGCSYENPELLKNINKNS